MASKAPSLFDIIKDMKAKYESPVNKITRDAKKVYGHFFPVKNLQTVAMIGVKTIMFKAESTGSNGDIYNCSIQMKGVDFSETAEKDRVAVSIVDKEELNGKKVWFYKKPSLTKSPCAVHCTCSDFRFRWEKPLFDASALIGSFEKYTPVAGSTRPSVNPNGALGVCKHLYSMAEALKNSGLVGP